MTCRIRVVGLTAIVGCLAAADSAHAAPTIVSAEVQGSPLEGLTIAVVATDPKESINAVRVAFPEGEGSFGESACVIGRDGEPRRTGVFSPGRKVRFEVPYEPETSGVHLLKVTVVSGACGGEKSETSLSVAATVTLPDLPPVPTPTVPPLPGLPNLPGGVETAVSAAAACANADLAPSASSVKRVRGAVQCLINAERAARGLTRLRSKAGLRKAATRHSRDMIRRRYLDHDGPNGPTLVDRLRKVGYWPAIAAENIGAGTSTLGTARAMVTAWMGSEPHRTNILTPSWKHLGVGIAVPVPDGGSGATYTIDFGRR